jgi:hypothetical protein
MHVGTALSSFASKQTKISTLLGSDRNSCRRSLERDKRAPNHFAIFCCSIGSPDGAQFDKFLTQKVGSLDIILLQTGGTMPTVHWTPM